MELDQLLNLTSTVAQKLLPILGAAALVFLIIFLRKLIALLVTSNDAANAMKTTLESANRQLDALDKPMQTLNELSETVDNVHDASKNMLRSILTTIIDNMGDIIHAFTGAKAEDASTINEVQKESVRGEESHGSNE